MREIVIGVDLGGTKTAAALVDAAGNLVSEKVRVPTPGQQGGEAMLDAMAVAISQQYAQLGGDRLVGIGVGTAGAVDTERGVIVSATETVTGWLGTDLVSGLRRRLDWAAELPIQVQNDVDAHAVGENWRGAGAGAASMLMLAVGTGIGAAFCLDGAVWRGAHHMAGEVGSLRVRFNDGLPEQGSSEAPAVFEANAAGPAIAQIYRQLGGRAEVRRGQDVMELAKAGDQTADRAIHGLGRRVGRVLSWLVLALDPEVVVLGGGVPTPRTSWWTGLSDELRAGLPPILREVPVKRATQRNNAALLGAGRDAFRLAGVATAE